MKRDRTAHGWSLRDMYAKTGYHIGNLSSVENGHRLMSEKLAIKCDEVFPERHGWYVSEYDASKSWIPPGLRSWAEYEDKATRLYVWCPGNVHGLFQTPDYARVYLSTLPSVPGEVIDTRLANRMARQRRVLDRDDPPTVVYVLDHTALFRGSGSAETMAGQMRRLIELASRPNVTVQVLPPVAHAATASELIIADDSAVYCEHLAAGGVYTEPDTVTRLSLVFNTIRSECYRASESAALLKEAERQWTGASRVTAARTDRASK